jgi:hypothetical protein
MCSECYLNRQRFIGQSNCFAWLGPIQSFRLRGRRRFFCWMATGEHQLSTGAFSAAAVRAAAGRSPTPAWSLWEHGGSRASFLARRAELGQEKPRHMDARRLLRVGRTGGTRAPAGSQSAGSSPAPAGAARHGW